MGKKSSAIYNVSYHIVWCSKFRKPILVGKVKEEQLETIAKTKGYKILDARVKPDPFDSPTNVVKVFKGVTGLRMFRKFPDLESKLWRGVMWSLSYYIGTAGNVSVRHCEKSMYIPKSTCTKLY